LRSESDVADHSFGDLVEILRLGRMLFLGH